MNDVWTARTTRTARVFPLLTRNCPPYREHQHGLWVHNSHSFLNATVHLFTSRTTLQPYAERAICYRPSVCPSVWHTDGSDNQTVNDGV